MTIRVRLLALLLALGCCLPAAAIRYYVRNREVVGRAAGNDVYLTQEQLRQVLSSEDFARLRWLPDGSVSLGEAVSPDRGPEVSMAWVAGQLGLTQRVQPGEVGWLKVASKQLPVSPEALQASSRRPEYQEAARRLKRVLEELPVSNDQAQQERVARVGNSVVAACPLHDMEWHFVVVQSDSPNAACVGEGHVFVTDSLLAMGLSDGELAGVLGHEIAHGVRRHCFRRADLLRDMINLLQSYNSIVDQLNSGTGSLTLRSSMQDYERRRDQLQYKFDHDVFYTRLDEEEADVLGMRYAVTAGYPAEGLGDCLQRLDAHVVKQFGTAVLREDMSHPPVKRRLEILGRARHNGKF